MSGARSTYPQSQAGSNKSRRLGGLSARGGGRMAGKELIIMLKDTEKKLKTQLDKQSKELGE